MSKKFRKNVSRVKFRFVSLFLISKKPVSVSNETEILANAASTEVLPSRWFFVSVAALFQIDQKCPDFVPKKELKYKVLSWFKISFKLMRDSFILNSS